MKYYKRDEAKKDDINWSCSSHRRIQTRMQILTEKDAERDHSEDACVIGEITLKWTEMKQCENLWTGCICFSIGW
jgi:hypothetical protein